MKGFFLAILLVLLLAIGYMIGSHGTDPTQWFAPPTPTPTFTSTFTATSTSTGTPTMTFTPTATMTATPAPKKKIAKKHTSKPKKKWKPEKEVEADEDVEEPKPKPTLLPPQPPEKKPICNAQSLPSAVAGLGTNHTFLTAQPLGELTAKGLQVNATLSKVVQTADTAAADAYKVDPNVESTDLDVSVYSFTTASPCFVVLDCYTHVVGRPDPLYHDNNYQLDIYNETFTLVGSSHRNDPVEAVDLSDLGKTFYVVVYGVDGEPGAYRLTINPK